MRRESESRKVIDDKKEDSAKPKKEVDLNPKKLRSSG